MNRFLVKRAGMTRVQEHTHNVFETLLAHARSCTDRACIMCNRINGERG